MEPNLPDVVLWSIPAFVLLTVIEMVSYRFHPDEDAAGYDTKDAATSLTMGLGSLGFDLLWKIPILAVYMGVYELTPLRVPVLWWTVLLMLLAQDFFYYWSHRGHHVIRILWACHVVHHSSEKFNLTTALRQPWTSATVWPFYLPLIACGVHPAALAFCQSANLVYQFWVHTERVGKLPRPFEYVLNTPSHHRVHHASQGGYLDRNYGGILIIWDRMFGSFAAETERPVYGLTKNIATHNPLRVATHEYAAIARDVRAAGSWSERAGRVFRGPGWQPSPRPGAEAAVAVPAPVSVEAAAGPAPVRAEAPASVTAAAPAPAPEHTR
ncbi:sterol desaturase family protein [Streptomyces microflavus]|uniref:C-5 sterol desaturase n=1 Tax=Streptomyces microflavus TaxID=1919 RepID=A0A7J0CL13_STRMI|nr:MULTISPECIES: sterol desaturase family protein [Streptomyces]MDX2976242.1 sterol desaturase family protein [Streptomyces sp. NRRL_B-2249]GFN02978.1 C-5 sterol desaturase [Streptomyces microflavus]GGX95981.1 C-5 sterol desaturase [Streptomyces microflavus]